MELNWMAWASWSTQISSHLWEDSYCHFQSGCLGVSKTLSLHPSHTRPVTIVHVFRSCFKVEKQAYPHTLFLYTSINWVSVQHDVCGCSYASRSGWFGPTIVYSPKPGYWSIGVLPHGHWHEWLTTCNFSVFDLGDFCRPCVPWCYILFES